MKKSLHDVKIVFASLRANFSKHLAYRFKLFIWVAAAIVEPLIWSALWYVTAKNGKGMSLTSDQVLTYYLFIAFVSRITASWTFDDLREKILNGSYSKYLLLPANIFQMRFGEDLGQKLLNVITVLPFWLIWMVVLVANNVVAINVSGILLFIIALIFAIAVQFCLDMILAHLALWFSKTEGVAIVYHSVSRVLGGIIVPLILLPGWAYSISKLTVFRYIYSFPVEILQGLLSRSDVILGFGVMGIWISALLLAYYLMQKFGLKKYEAVGI